MRWRREGRPLVRDLSRRMDWFTVHLDLPILYVIPGLTVRTIAMVLYFFIEPYSFPRRPYLGTSVLFRSGHQRLHWGLVQVTIGYATDVSIWNFVGSTG